MEPNELYLLVTRYLARQTSLAENERLATWLAESVEHERTFEQLKAVWQHSQAAPAPTETAAALRQVKARLELPAPVRSPWLLKPRRRAYLLAAVVLLLGLVGAQYFLAGGNSALRYRLTKTRAGEKQQLRLADGSVVTLAPRSQLRYPVRFGGAHCDVYLEGEAFFEISKDARRPFRVHSGSWVTQVLGTKFNVNAVPGASQTAVSVVEGRVQVFDKQEKYLLTPGQQLLAERTTGRLYRRAFDVKMVTGWRRNRLVFQNEKLADVAGQMERLYGVKLVFADAATAEVRLWATFDNEPLQAVLEALELAGNLRARREGQVIYLQQAAPDAPPN